MDLVEKCRTLSRAENQRRLRGDLSLSAGPAERRHRPELRSRGLARPWVDQVMTFVVALGPLAARNTRGRDGATFQANEPAFVFARYRDRPLTLALGKATD